jgi:methionine sulfoxide reductase heme-binding subunit
MSQGYQAVGWNAEKQRYDVAFAAILLTGLLLFVGVSVATHPGVTPETIVIRFTAIAALVLLHVILAIGPLARLDRRFLPLLYNRRHLGVAAFLLALVHAVFAVFQFHAWGDRNPIVSALTAYRQDYHSGQLAHFPFEVFGAGALVILFMMAATSHDFWLKNLGPSVWKLLHTGVYAAYLLLVAHVFLGAIQTEISPAFPVLMGFGFVVLVALHAAAAVAWRGRMTRRAAEHDGFVPVARSAELREGQGMVVPVGAGKAALFLHGGLLFAVSNICRHQGGPIGEGRIVSKCITCPWHGYQYRPEDGCSPPPFKEVLPTYRLRLADGIVHIHPDPLPPETPSDGVAVDNAAGDQPAVEPFYIGWRKKPVVMHVTAKRIAWATAAVAALGVFAAAAALQNPFDAGVFEFGTIRSFQGVLRAEPVPHLASLAPSGAAGPAILVSGEGKFGVPPALMAAHDGQHVEFNGTLIAREGMTMVQMDDPGSFRVLDPARLPARDDTDLGRVVLEGELVDTKCFFGVMRPATGKVHRGCAVRCLSGGVPPGVLVRDGEGNGRVILLAGPPGRPLDYDVEWAARMVRASGALQMHRGIPVLRTVSLALLPADATHGDR